MKYIKTFEQLDIKVYIIATMPEWYNDIYLFKTLKVKDNKYYYNIFYNIENDSIKETEAGENRSYNIDSLDILYQTDNFEEAKLNLKELELLYKNIKKYNL